MLLAGDPEHTEGFGGMSHGVPVRLASHDDGDWGGHAVNSLRESKSIGRIIGSAQGSARRGKGSGMDYPVLVNRGKPFRAAMTKKTRVPASGTAKRSKTGGKARRIAAPRGTRTEAATRA